MTHPKARRTKCRDCRTRILYGVDSDLCGFPTRVDPAPLTAAGEAIARLLGLGTYALRTDGALHRRDRFQIEGKPAGVKHPLFPQDVVAEHRCGIDLTEYTAPSNLDVEAQRIEESNECPF